MGRSAGVAPGNGLDVLEKAFDTIASLATRAYDCDAAGFISPGSSVARKTSVAGRCGRVSDSGKDKDGEGGGDKDWDKAEGAGGVVGF